MAEFFLALVVFGHLYGFIYAVSVASMQAFSLFDILSSGGEDNSQYQGIRRILSQETRAVLLAAEAFRALLLAIVVLVVISWTPKWCAILGLSIGVCRIVALLVSWLLYLLAAEVMPKRAVGKEPGRKLAIVRVAVLVAIWWVLRPIVWAAERIAEWRSPERSPAERDEIVERAIDTLAESSGLDEPVIEPEERAMIQGVIG
ncbi:MAG: hypothetical protein HY304_05755, partial [candidate division Zixibacteria bacterium]|nr:hypothetical protein [candidate division Zixibacteria bacterium]